MNATVNKVPFRLEHVTGRILSEKRFKATDLGADGKKSKDGPPRSDTVTEFWLANDTGGEHCYTVHANLTLRPGQHVSLITAHGPSQSMLVAIANHANRRVTYTAATEHTLRWLGLKGGNMLTVLAYILCALICLPLWFASDGNIILSAGIVMVCAVGVQFGLGKRDKNKEARAAVEYRQHVAAYADQICTAVAVMESSAPESVLESAMEQGAAG